MTFVDFSLAIWHIDPDGITLTPNEKAPDLLRLQLCEDIRIVLEGDSDDTARQAAAMRKLSGLAAEAAAELERQAAERKGCQR
jgi:hypothetical protein